MFALQRLQSCSILQPRMAQRPGLRVWAASKGFGKQTAQPKPKPEEGPPVPGQGSEQQRRLKFKGKKQMRRGAPQEQPAAQPGFNMLSEEDAAGAKESLVEQIEFEQRLKALAAESEERRKEQQRAAAAGGGVLDAGRREQAEDIYANVQPLSKTLLPRDDSSANKEYEGSSFGPSQAGLAVAAVLLGAVFLVTSGGGDFAPSGGSSGTVSQQQAAGQQLGEEQRKDLEGQLATLKEQLAANGDDLDALEGSAVLNFKLGRFGEAEALLSRLSKARPQDAEVLRVLAEAQAAQGEWGPSQASYRAAWQASGRASLEVLQGLAGALVADGKEAAAVEAVQGAQAPGGSAGIGEVELALLAGKTYAQWRGHAPDALAVYDQLIERFPEDFRAYLAKGLLLKDQGREGDATRYFIQAKFYAKGANRKLVDAIVDARQ